MWIYTYDYGYLNTAHFPFPIAGGSIINKSLSALGDVISALSSGQDFILYRNNSLTLLMHDSLGGKRKDTFHPISSLERDLSNDVFGIMCVCVIRLAS